MAKKRALENLAPGKSRPRRYEKWSTSDGNDFSDSLDKKPDQTKGQSHRCKRTTADGYSSEIQIPIRVSPAETRL